MATLLCVRGPEFLPAAIRSVNEYLAVRRGQGMDPAADEVLGVWLGGATDADRVGTCGSVSLAGVWTLCWLDGMFPEGVEAAGERRKLLIRGLPGAEASADAGSEGGFVAVVTEGESAPGVIDSLGIYGAVIRREWLRYDRGRGIVAE